MYLVPTSKTSAPLRVIRGRSLAQRKLGAAQKASIAAGILAGEVTIELSVSQLARLVGVSVPYISAARQLTPEVRRSIADGEGTLSFTLLLKSPLSLPKPVTDTQLVNIIRDAGLDRTLAAACAVENVA
jgi:hypothetical protein